VLTAVVIVLVVVTGVVLASVTKLPPHTRGVVYRLGRVLPHPFGPGIVVTVPGIDRMVRVSIVEQKIDIPRATVTTSAGQSQSDFTVAYKIVDPVKAVTEVADYREAIATAARRAIEHGLTEGGAYDVGARVRSDLSDVVRPWGIQIQSVTAKKK